MGNKAGKFKHCFAGDVSRRHDLPAGMFSDEGLGHSFCYIRPDPDRISSSEEESLSFTAKTFRSISGASVSANTTTPPSTSLIDISSNYNSCDRASAFESSTSFASIPLQPVPRGTAFSGGGFSGPMEKGFLSGPIERGFVSGPIDRGMFSGPIDKVTEKKIYRSVSLAGVDVKRGRKFKRQGVIKSLRRAISSTISRSGKNLVSSFKGIKGKDFGRGGENVGACSSTISHGGGDDDDDDGDFSMKSQNLQWAQGKAGEDRVHMVISEQHGWVFVGIYDGFNGPDAPDYLLSNLYNAVHKELKGLLWNERFESCNTSTVTSSNSEAVSYSSEDIDQPCPVSPLVEKGYCLGNGDVDLKSDLSRLQGINSRKSRSSSARKMEENQTRWKGEWNRERMELERKLSEQLNSQSSNGVAPIKHDEILNALAEALKKTEDAYLDMADKMVTVNPELALMGSCVLGMLMKGEDVYLMNVGDSRAVLARKAEPDLGYGKMHQDLGRIKEESFRDLEDSDADEVNSIRNLTSVQLTVDHSSYVEEEVLRIKNEHLDDASAMLNDRVKGYLKVTRAFGAGFLKQPKWNDALLEMFRIDYVGTSPYINCEPYVYHHRLGPRDWFLILSSDGLYQYFTNEEAVAEVQSFISSFPEGDPAQHLIEEVLFRAAKKAGMDFHELIDIPQGDRRRYHDDVSIIIISFEGRIWRSSMATSLESKAHQDYYAYYTDRDAHQSPYYIGNWHHEKAFDTSL